MERDIVIILQFFQANGFQKRLTSNSIATSCDSVIHLVLDILVLLAFKRGQSRFSIYFPLEK